MKYFYVALSGILTKPKKLNRTCTRVGWKVMDGREESAVL